MPVRCRGHPSDEEPWIDSLRRCRALGDGAPSSRGRRAVEVDDEWTFSDDGENDFLWFIERVDVTVDQPGRYMEEPAFLDLRALLTTRAELEAGPSAHNVPQDVTVTVVMPTRGGPRRGTSAHQRCAIGLESDLAHDARCGGGDPEAIWGDGGNPFGDGHGSDYRAQAAQLKSGKSPPNESSPIDGISKIAWSRGDGLESCLRRCISVVQFTAIVLLKRISAVPLARRPDRSYANP